METITIRFTSRWPWNPLSKSIALATGSRDWSHTMCIIDDMAYEATMMHGCRVVPLDVAMKGVTSYKDMIVPVSIADDGVAWGTSQKGRPYDWAGAFGLPLLRSEDWSDERKWWCSEHTFKLLGMAGTWLLDPAEHNRVTPDDLHQCNFPKSPIVRVR
jgi:hypothetical protein